MDGNKISLGTAQFGLNYGISNTQGKPSETKVFKILETAYGKGVRYLDTAEIYGDAHQLIGKFHDLYSLRFKIVTKLNLSNFQEKNITLKDHVQNNLETLRLDQINSYMFHSYYDLKSSFQTLETELEQLKSDGRILNYGVSVYTNDEFKDVIENYPVDIIQLPYNVFDNDNLRLELVKNAKEKGIIIHTRSVFLQGLFFKKPEELPIQLIGLKQYLNELISISNKYNLSIQELALKYVNDIEFIDKIVLGVITQNQLEENLKVLARDPMVDLRKSINNIKVEEINLLNPSNWNL